MKLIPTLFLSTLITASSCALSAATPQDPVVSLKDSLMPSAIKSVAAGSVDILGTTKAADATPIRVRVTSSIGTTFLTRVDAKDGRFVCHFPQDFPGAPALTPMLLYVDATDAAEFGEAAASHDAEALLIVAGTHNTPPDLPLIFMDDLLDVNGHADAESVQWPRTRTLVNLFMHSRAAHLMKINRLNFDLNTPADFAWFKDHATLYDFDHRDRDWSRPLGHRVARGYWRAVWSTWFNASNDHPLDGNAANHARNNFRPYTFTNDAADLLVLYQMLHDAAPDVADNRRDLSDGVLANLLAMQHRSSENFALKEVSGKQEHYTAGAFRYGIFETGEWLTEGTGWFVNPKFRDFARGGVFNGRAVWALGVSLKAAPKGPRARAVRDALGLALRFCLHDGLALGYTVPTKSGLPIWNRTAGEHAYLLLGMLAACEVDPDMPVKLSDDAPARQLSAVTIDALNALAESAPPDGNWTKYANATAMNIAALAEGVRVFKNHEASARWKDAAVKAADFWIALQPVPAERKLPTPLFGQLTPEGCMTFRGNKNDHAHMPLYIGGHWLHALAALHSVTKNPNYAARAQAILSYYCGNNPLHVRLLNELGAVNNRVTDMDGDGVEDTLHWDAYPESTAFVQIGLLYLLAQ